LQEGLNTLSYNVISMNETDTHTITTVSI
jgi:hypothetical protein